MSNLVNLDNQPRDEESNKLPTCADEKCLILMILGIH